MGIGGLAFTPAGLSAVVRPGIGARTSSDRAPTTRRLPTRPQDWRLRFGLRSG